jgi:hypothetical protein
MTMPLGISDEPSACRSHFRAGPEVHTSAVSLSILSMAVRRSPLAA